MSATPTKADEIALILEEAILSGELAPGLVLRQEQLSEEFGVSRERVRQIEVRAFEKVQDAVKKALVRIEAPRAAISAASGQ